MVAWAALLSPGIFAQELLHQEGFNDDGAAANPPRYTVTGGFKSEYPHEVGIVDAAADQTGPVYWARNVEVSYTGVPAPTRGRRAALAWEGTLGSGTASTDTLRLVANTVKWLANDKPNATVVFAPNAAAAQGLADHLASLGYNVVDDDGTTSDTAYPGDAIVKGVGSLPSRFALAPQGVLNFSALDHDDMLVSSIGSNVAFEAGPGEIEAASHPVASGVPASFTVATGSVTWNLLGDILPGDATTVATFVRVVPPTAANLADVDAMAAGTKPATKTTETSLYLDYADGSAGDWFIDTPIPGGATGVWGLVAKGRLNVKAAGRYSFALGMDDGARLRIDANRNGLGPEDNVINEDVAGAHRAVYGDVQFAATGLYDFEVTSFNSGGSGDIEMSVSLLPGNDTSAINSGTWELLGTTTGNVELSGNVTVDLYVPSGPDEEVTLPFLALLNGPNDTPPGSVFGGGPFTGFEGTGFFGGAGLNKWLPEPIADLGGYRSVQLRPVNVAGKSNVKLTIALAATFLDFEDSDFLDLIAYPNGLDGGEVRLARYSAPDAASKYFVDIDHGNSNRLGLTFQDVTYDVPAGATSLVIELRSFTSWWNEIVAFDNVRITSGDLASPATLGTPTASNGNINLTWTGGQAPFLVQWTAALPATWVDVYTTSASSASIPIVGPGGFFRVQSGATKTVKLFKASLSGANENPAVDTPAAGSGLFALDGDVFTYYVHYEGLKAVATASHIHGPAPTTGNAGVLFGLNPAAAYGTSGILSGTQTLTAEQKGHLEGGQTYANIHTSAHGGGEIRGQVLAVP